MALGKTVAELKATLTDDELVAWREFYIRWPFDDLHRFHRPAALIACSFGGDEKRLRSVLDWLQPPPESPDGVDFFSLVGK